MISMIGAAVFFAKMVGIAIVVATLLTALLYHLGWRNDHPTGFWPMRSILGFGGVMLAGVGFIVGSLFFILIGIGAYFFGLILGPKSVTPPVV